MAEPGRQGCGREARRHTLSCGTANKSVRGGDRQCVGETYTSSAILELTSWLWMLGGGLENLLSGGADGRHCGGRVGRGGEAEGKVEIKERSWRQNSNEDTGGLARRYDEHYWKKQCAAREEKKSGARAAYILDRGGPVGKAFPTDRLDGSGGLRRPYRRFSKRQAPSRRASPAHDGAVWAGLACLTRPHFVAFPHLIAACLFRPGVARSSAASHRTLTAPPHFVAGSTESTFAHDTKILTTNDRTSAPTTQQCRSPSAAECRLNGYVTSSAIRSRAHQTRLPHRALPPPPQSRNSPVIPMPFPHPPASPRGTRAIASSVTCA